MHSAISSAVQTSQMVHACHCRCPKEYLMHFEDVVESIQVSRQALRLGQNPAAVSAGTCSYMCANSSVLLEHYGTDWSQGFGWDLTLPGRASENRGGLSKPFQEFFEHRFIAAVTWVVVCLFFFSPHFCIHLIWAIKRQKVRMVQTPFPSDLCLSFVQ